MPVSPAPLIILCTFLGFLFSRYFYSHFSSRFSSCTLITAHLTSSSSPSLSISRKHHSVHPQSSFIHASSSSFASSSFHCLSSIPLSPRPMPPEASLTSSCVTASPYLKTTSSKVLALVSIIMFLAAGCSSGVLLTTRRCVSVLSTLPSPARLRLAA